MGSCKWTKAMLGQKLQFLYCSYVIRLCKCRNWGNMHDLAVGLLVSVGGSNLERPIPDLRAFLALQGANKLKCPIRNFLCSSYWILSSVLPSWERKPIAVIIIIIVWQRSLGRSLESQRPRRGVECGGLRRIAAASMFSVAIISTLTLLSFCSHSLLYTLLHCWKTRISLF